MKIIKVVSLRSKWSLLLPLAFYTKAIQNSSNIGLTRYLAGV